MMKDKKGCGHSMRPCADPMRGMDVPDMGTKAGVSHTYGANLDRGDSGKMSAKSGDKPETRRAGPMAKGFA